MGCKQSKIDESLDGIIPNNHGNNHKTIPIVVKEKNSQIINEKLDDQIDNKLVDSKIIDNGLIYYDKLDNNSENVHNLCKLGKLEELKEILSNDISNKLVNSIGMWGSTLLIIALQYNHILIVHYLLSTYQNLLDINHINEKGANALLYACMEGYSDIVDVFINKYKCNLIFEPAKGIYNSLYDAIVICNPLTIACMNNHGKIVDILLNNYLKVYDNNFVNHIYNYQTIYHLNTQSISSGTMPVRIKLTNQSNELLDQTAASLSNEISKNLTILMICCFYSSYNVIELLFKKYIDIDVHITNKYTNYLCIHYLLRTIDQNQRDIEINIIDILDLFSSYLSSQNFKLYVESFDIFGYTILHLAIEKRYIKVVNYLLDKSINPNISINESTNYIPIYPPIYPIELAVKRRSVDIINSLLVHGANPLVCNDNCLKGLKHNNPIYTTIQYAIADWNSKHIYSHVDSKLSSQIDTQLDSNTLESQDSKIEIFKDLEIDSNRDNDTKDKIDLQTIITSSTKLLADKLENIEDFNRDRKTDGEIDTDIDNKIVSKLDSLEDNELDKEIDEIDISTNITVSPTKRSIRKINRKISIDAVKRSVGEIDRQADCIVVIHNTIDEPIEQSASPNTTSNFITLDKSKDLLKKNNEVKNINAKFNNKINGNVNEINENESKIDSKIVSTVDMKKDTTLDSTVNIEIANKNDNELPISIIKSIDRSDNEDIDVIDISNNETTSPNSQLNKIKTPNKGNHSHLDKKIDSTTDRKIDKELISEINIEAVSVNNKYKSDKEVDKSTLDEIESDLIDHSNAINIKANSQSTNESKQLVESKDHVLPNELIEVLDITSIDETNKNQSTSQEKKLDDKLRHDIKSNSFADSKATSTVSVQRRGSLVKQYISTNNRRSSRSDKNGKINNNIDRTIDINNVVNDPIKLSATPLIKIDNIAVEDEIISHVNIEQGSTINNKIDSKVDDKIKNSKVDSKSQNKIDSRLSMEIVSKKADEVVGSIIKSMGRSDSDLYYNDIDVIEITNNETKSPNSRLNKIESQRKFDHKNTDSKIDSKIHNTLDEEVNNEIDGKTESVSTTNNKLKRDTEVDLSTLDVIESELIIHSNAIDIQSNKETNNGIKQLVDSNIDINSNHLKNDDLIDVLDITTSSTNKTTKNIFTSQDKNSDSKVDHKIDSKQASRKDSKLDNSTEGTTTSNIRVQRRVSLAKESVNINNRRSSRAEKIGNVVGKIDNKIGTKNKIDEPIEQSTNTKTNIQIDVRDSDNTADQLIMDNVAKNINNFNENENMIDNRTDNKGDNKIESRIDNKIDISLNKLSMNDGEEVASNIKLIDRTDSDLYDNDIDVIDISNNETKSPNSRLIKLGIPNNNGNNKIENNIDSKLQIKTDSTFDSKIGSTIESIIPRKIDKVLISEIDSEAVSSSTTNNKFKSDKKVDISTLDVLESDLIDHSNAIDIQSTTENKNEIKRLVDSKVDIISNRNLKDDLIDILDITTSSNNNKNKNLPTNRDKKLDSKVEIKIDNKIDSQQVRRKDSKSDSTTNSKTTSKVSVQRRESLAKDSVNTNNRRSSRSEKKDKSDTKIDIKSYNNIDIEIESQIENKLDNKIVSDIDSKLDVTADNKVDSKIDYNIESDLNNELVRGAVLENVDNIIHKSNEGFNQTPVRPSILSPRLTDPRKHRYVRTQVKTIGKVENNEDGNVVSSTISKIDEQLDKQIDNQIDEKIVNQILISKEKDNDIVYQTPTRPSVNRTNSYKKNNLVIEANSSRSSIESKLDD